MKFPLTCREPLRYLLLSSFLVLLLLMNIPSIFASSDKDEVVLRLKEGEGALIPGTETKIVIKSVIDLTSSGCLGGPIGCRDKVIIEIHDSKKIREVVLEKTKTALQKKQKIDQTSIDGKTIRLTSLSKKEAELVVEESPTGEKDQ